MSKMNEQKLSISMIFLLGLVPGLVILFWAFVFSSPFFGINFSIILSLMLAIILGLIPTELGILTFIFNGFLGPMVEEVYFRGYLLPRMGVFGKFAPLINAIIFSLYHFFTPWQNITRIVGVTPMVYSVWINKDIRIGIIVHCLGNIIGALGMIKLLFA